jgi:hypothetical protein
MATKAPAWSERNTKTVAQEGIAPSLRPLPRSDDRHALGCFFG